MTTDQRRLPGWMLGTSVIAVSMGLMNVATYGFTLLTARLLGPREYGAVAAIMGLALVLNVVALGLQATAARRVSTEGAVAGAPQTERAAIRASYLVASWLAGLVLVATPLVATFLRLDSWLPVVLLAAAMWPLTVMGAQAGLLQGERRWPELAGIYLAMGLGRLVFGLAAVAWRPDVTGALAGVAVGSFAPMLLGHWLLARRRARDATGTPAAQGHAATGVLREILHNSHALLAFFTLSTADVLIARNVLDDHQAGLYAGGLILAKAVLFLPQFVVVLAFPGMADASGGRRTQRLALATVAAIGAVATLAAYLFPWLAVLFVGGEDYGDIEGRIWAFAAIGTLCAMVQLLVYGTVARQHRRAVWVLWGGVSVLVVVAIGGLDSVTGLLAVVAGVDAVVLLLLLALGSREGRPLPPPAVALG